jgi:hypothetical protein
VWWGERAEPTWPGSAQDAVRWLSERGGAADREVEDLVSPVDVLIAGRQFGWTDTLVPNNLFESFVDRRALRRARTSRARIGSWPADAARISDVHEVLHPLLRRLCLALLVIAGGMASGASVVQVALLVLAVPFFGVRTPIGVVIALAGVPFGWETWWLPPLCAMSLHVVVLVLPLGVWFRARGDRRALLGFLPLRTLWVLALTGKLPVFATAVDLSGGDNADLATSFLDACGDLPTECAPVVEMCRARVAFHRGDLDAAIAGAAKARDTAATPVVHGWCALGTASVLLASGRAEDGREALVAAVGLLTTRRTRRWRDSAALALLELDLEQDDVVAVLRQVHAVRLRALRAHDNDLLTRTEVWLARLAVRHGSGEHVAWTLRQIVGGEDGRANVARTRDDTAAELLMRATVDLSRPEAAARVRADADAALVQVDARRRPLAAVNARLVLARLCEAQDDPVEALGHVAEALLVANRARYQLPSGRWRAQWSSRQLDLFATALRLADTAGDSELVAELLESARGEVLPAATSAADASLLGLLRQFDEPGLATDDGPTPLTDVDAALVMAGFSPVTRPPVAQIGGGRLPVADDAETFDLDLRLVATAGRCWYWSAVAVADRHYWAVRTPEGRWTHGWVDQRPGSRAAAALTALALALPLERDGEDHQDIARRVLSGPLGRPGEPGGELRLLADIADVFLPEPLRRGLAAEAVAGRKLVVSLPAGLSHLPVAWLPLSVDPDVRVVERAAVVHVPGWAVVERCLDRPRTPVDAPRPVRAAIVNAGGATDITTLAVPPPGAAHTTARPLSKADVSALLTALSDRRDWLLYLVGHVVGEPGNAGLHGLEVAGAGLDGVLMIRDLVSGAFPVPSRAVVVGCDSMGMATGASADRGGALTNEWLGFSAAMMLAGADDICCTAYPVYENRTFLRLAHQLAQRLTTAPDAARAVAEVQRERLARWRETGAGLPVLWQSFVYIGRG